MASSNRKYDLNGFYEIKRNPISRVGVFDYIGASMGLTGEDAGKIFKVYRPASEIGAQESLDSFKLCPFVDDHTMIEGAGGDGNLTPAEEKGVHGVTGEQLSFEADGKDAEPGGIVYANLKVWSKALDNKTKRGKKQVSMGYRCRYERKAGTWRGKAYDFIQSGQRGNHGALVDAARMGADIQVLDARDTFAMDAADVIEIDEADAVGDAIGQALDALTGVTEPQQGLNPAILPKILAAAQAIVAACSAATPAPPAPDDQPQPDDKGTKDMADETLPAGAGTDTLPAGAGADTLPAGAGADAAAITDLRAQLDTANAQIAALKGRPTLDAADVMKQISQRDTLALRLKPHVGAFDHASMSLDEVIKHGVTKLELKDIPTGQDATALNFYLNAAGNPGRVAATHAVVDAADAAPATGSPVGDFLANANK